MPLTRPLWLGKLKTIIYVLVAATVMAACEPSAGHDDNAQQDVAGGSVGSSLDTNPPTENDPSSKAAENRPHDELEFLRAYDQSQIYQNGANQFIIDQATYNQRKTWNNNTVKYLEKFDNWTGTVEKIEENNSETIWLTIKLSDADITIKSEINRSDPIYDEIKYFPDKTPVLMSGTLMDFEVDHIRNNNADQTFIPPETCSGPMPNCWVKLTKIRSLL